MIHNREQLLNWLVTNSKNDVLLRKILNDSGTRVELFGLFDPLPVSQKSGWLLSVTSYFGYKDLVAIVKDNLGRASHFFFAPYITWNTWHGPSEDVLEGGDNTDQYVALREAYNEQKGINLEGVHRIQRHTTVHTKQNKGTCNKKTGPPVVKKRSYPPVVSPKH